VVHAAGGSLDYRHPVGMPRLFQIANVGLAVLAAACASVSASIPAAETHFRVANDLVLGLDDVKSGATLTVDSPLTAGDAVVILGIRGIATDAFAHNGLTNAYVRAFAWKDPSAAVTRALATTTFLFSDPKGAHQTLSLFTDAAEEAGAGQMSIGGTVGDESAGFQIDANLADSFGAAFSVTTTGIVFRHANALSLISYRVLSDEDDPGYVIGLARKQLALQKAVAPAGVFVPGGKVTIGVGSPGSAHVLATGLVLTAADLPAGMRTRDAGPISAQDFAFGDADIGAMFAKHGFVSAYGRVFTHKSQFGKEAETITSKTALMTDSAGAHKAFLEFADLASAIGAHDLGTVSAGDESRAFRLDDYSEDASYVEVLFRHRNALSVILIEFPGRIVNHSLTFDLAKKQANYQLLDLGLLKPFR
jgi:hypothetical protein